MAKKIDRKKVNFMVSKEILLQLNQIVPSGQRSNFINRALKEALTRYSRGKALQELDKIANSGEFKLSAKKFLKTRHEGLLR